VNSIFVGDQLKGVCKGLHLAVKFQSKLSVLFAIRLDLPVQTWRFLRVAADKEFALQIGQSHPILGRKPGTKRRAYLEENAGAVDVKLSEDDMARLEAALRPEAVSGPRYNEKLIAWVDR
jgi:hypothetical protein